MLLTALIRFTCYSSEVLQLFMTKIVAQAQQDANEMADSVPQHEQHIATYKGQLKAKELTPWSCEYEPCRTL